MLSNYPCGIHYLVPIMALLNVLNPTHPLLQTHLPLSQRKWKVSGKYFPNVSFVMSCKSTAMLKNIYYYPNAACWKMEFWRYYVTFPKSQKLCVLEKESE